MTSTPHLLPRFARRALAIGFRRLFRPSVDLVWDARYNAAFPGLPNDHLRAERILAFLASEGLVLRRCVHQPRMASVMDLERLHGPGYLDKVQDAVALTSIMGTEILQSQVDRILDLQRLMTGGTQLATGLALKSRTLAVNLGGGFHHAHRDSGGGFCVFNDVAVAIETRRAKGWRGRVLVVDLDLHDGDGTRAIYRDDPEVHTFSIHARHWGETEAVASTSIELGAKVDDSTYLEAIEEHLPRAFADHRPELVFYLAGCDPAEDDPLGDWRVSPAAMLERDRQVVRLTRQRRQIPTVVLLAGGYGHETWRYTARFLSEQLRFGGPIEPPSSEEIALQRYRHLDRLLDRERSRDESDEFRLRDADVFLPGWGVQPETRLLGHYTRMSVELILERSGLIDRLRDLGYEAPELELDLADPAGQTVRLLDSPERSEVLAELRLNRDRRSLAGFELLTIEWLLLQNPRGRFDHGRKALPGQVYPGLGVVSDVAALLSLACEQLHLDGLIFVPSQLYIAELGSGYLRFLDPAAEQRFQALLEVLHGLSIGAATRALAEGRVVDDATSEPVRWQPAPMVMPVSDKLKRYFDHRLEIETPPTLRYRLVDPLEQ